MTEAFSREVWRGQGGWLGSGLRVLLTPVALVVRALVSARNSFYDHRGPDQARLPVPVLSVGNLSVGGTGKTPILRWIRGHEAMSNLDLAVVTRGYGQDEVDLYRRWFGASRVFVDTDRWAAVRAAAKSGVDAVLLDDGFQHRRLPRHVDLVLLAAEAPLPLRLIPRGPFREPLDSLLRATAVVITARTAAEEAIAGWERLVRELFGRQTRRGRGFQEIPVCRADFRLVQWADLGGNAVEPPGGDILAVCSVANPESFFDMIEGTLGTAPERMAFPDHHEYTDADMDLISERSRGRCVVTTEKDAVKLAPLRGLDPTVFVIGLEPSVLGEDPLHEILRSFAQLARSWKEGRQA